MPAEFLQNKFGGVNQRLLRTESENFWEFNGCFPEWAGVQCRIPGKGWLQSYDGQVTQIVQTYNPIGYGPVIIQTPTAVIIVPWTPPVFNINPTPPLNLIINQWGGLPGLVIPGYNTTTGLNNGLGVNNKYKITWTAYNISTYLSNLVYYTNSLSDGNTIPWPNDEIPSWNYLPFQNAAISGSSTPPSNALLASLNSATTNQLHGNTAPPPNNNEVQSWTSTVVNTTGILDLSSLILGDTVVLATLAVTINGTNTEIPFNLPFASLQNNPHVSINSSDYLIPGSVAQTAYNFNAFGDQVSVPPDTEAGLYGMAQRNQSQSTSITFNSIIIYTCQLTTH
jgi:hypothetical protein